MSRKKRDEEEQDMQDINEVENVQVEETIDGQIPDPTNEELHGADDHAEELSDVTEDVSGSPEKPDADLSDGSVEKSVEDQDAVSPESGTNDDEQDTFDRAYVEKLRKESAKYRDRAKRTDELAHRLQVALVAADGRLADPEDLEYSDEYLDDPEALQDAITELIKRKPGLRSRKFHGDAGAGDRGSKHKAPVDLLQIMKSM